MDKQNIKTIFFYCIKLFDYYIFCNNWSTSYSMSLVKI